jgi:hypothetical protein
MRKALILLAIVMCGLALLCPQGWCATVETPQFSAPVPVGSDPNQVGSGSATKTDATHIKFFKHPENPTGPNFNTTSVTVPPDGTVVNVEDLAATPGLLPNNTLDLTNFDTTGQMLDDMFPETFGGTLISPITHGFCPKKIQGIDNSGAPFYAIAECDVAKKFCWQESGGGTGNAPGAPTNKVEKCVNNITDRQFQVIDVRKTVSGSEFSDLFPLPALLDGVIGDAQEKIAPYSAVLYPATIKSTSDRDFVWTWKVEQTDPDGKIITYSADLDQPYKHVYAYGIADLAKDDTNKEGLVSADYDPVNVEKNNLVTMFTASPFAIKEQKAVPGNDKMYRLGMEHFSPLIFLRKDAVNGRMRLSGYSSWNVDFLDDALINFKADQINMTNHFKDFWHIILSMNFNPVDVKNLTTGSGKYIAVVNQGTLRELDETQTDVDHATNTLIARDFGGGVHHTWRDMLYPSGSSTAIASTGNPGDTYIPHDVVSYVVFWKEVNDWAHNPAVNTGTLPTQNLTDNPNEIFEPESIVLVGPGMYHADVMTDVISGKETPFLVVASGDRAIDKSFYVYKISPDGKELDFDVATEFGQSGAGKQKIGVIGEPYKVVPPGGAASHWAPYAAVGAHFKGADAGGDKCGDIAITWRGEYTVWDPGIPTNFGALWFYNHDGDKVHFTKLAGPSAAAPTNEMFSPCVTVYYGTKIAGKCGFNEADKKEFCMPATPTQAEWQIAAVAARDFDGDGKDDLLVGNLNPMQIAGGGGYTAYAHLFVNVDPSDSSVSVPRLAAGVSPDKFIRTGFATTSVAPDSSDIGDYLLNVWGEKSGSGLAGVGALDVDPNGNIAAINGLPLMLPPFGCPQFKTDPYDTAVTSWPEMKFALQDFEKTNGNESKDANGNVVPSRCLMIHGFHTSTDSDEILRPLACNPPSSGTATDSCAKPCYQHCKDFCDNPANYNNYQMMCDQVLNQCPGGYLNGELSLPKTYRLADSSHGDGGSSDSGGSEFAMLWKELKRFVSENFTLISEAHADPDGAPPAGVNLCRTPGTPPPPADCSYSHFRMPRGHVMPGKREITTVLNTTPPTITPPPPPGTTPPPSGETPKECPCCEYPYAKTVVTKCSGGSSDAAIEKRERWNKALREAIAAGGGVIGESDLTCEPEYGVMRIQISIPNAAAPNTPTSELLSESINPALTGNIGSAALIQYRGTKPIDFFAISELPVDTNIVSKPTILMPTTAAVTSKFAKDAAQKKAMTLTPELSSAISEAASTTPDLANAEPIEPDLVTSLDVLPDNTMKFNNVIRWQVTAATMTKESGFAGAANNIIDVIHQPMMCSWSARCPESKAFEAANSYAKIDPATVLDLAKKYGSLCKNGVCPAEFFEKIGLPPYENYGWALISNKVVKAGETPSIDITEVNTGGTPPMEVGRGGACGCNVTADPPDAAWFVALLLMASMFVGSFVLVRVRAKKK